MLLQPEIAAWYPISQSGPHWHYVWHVFCDILGLQLTDPHPFLFSGYLHSWSSISKLSNHCKDIENYDRFHPTTLLVYGTQYYLNEQFINRHDLPSLRCDPQIQALNFSFLYLAS